LLDGIVKKAKTKYPKLTSIIEHTISNIPLETLWKKGHEWIQAPEKDFGIGLKLFQDILNVSPKDYWATLLVGGCYTWAQPPIRDLVKGETFIKEAINIMPDRSNAYTLLAQCYLVQGRKKRSHSNSNRYLI